MRIHSTCQLAFGTLALFFAGCGGEPKPAVVSGDPPAVVDEHGHPHEGPHGGQVIELGKEAYHAELVRDDKANSVTIYVLDSAAKNPVAIDAADVAINVKHEGKGEQFKLAASPQETDPPGKSSRFVSDNAELAKDLDAAGADAQLVLDIAEKQFRGKIEHGHDHQGHKQ